MRNAAFSLLVVSFLVLAAGDLLWGQERLATDFATKEGPGAHRLDDVPHHARVTGAPIIDGSLAYFDCRVIGRYPGGDHTIFVGEVVDAGWLDDGEPLIFHEGRYSGLA